MRRRCPTIFGRRPVTNRRSCARYTEAPVHGEWEVLAALHLRLSVVARIFGTLMAAKVPKSTLLKMHAPCIAGTRARRTRRGWPPCGAFCVLYARTTRAVCTFQADWCARPARHHRYIRGKLVFAPAASGRVRVDLHPHAMCLSSTACARYSAVPSATRRR